MNTLIILGLMGLGLAIMALAIGRHIGEVKKK